MFYELLNKLSTYLILLVNLYDDNAIFVLNMMHFISKCTITVYSNISRGLLEFIGVHV